jgi:MFS transporter, DHA1 family, multidrug resistance protein
MSSGTATGVLQAPVAWRRNLGFLWVAQFTAFFGYSFVNPFLAVYLRNDLGVRDQSSLAFWTGLALGATGVTMAVANPIWGVLGDRLGLKPSVARAMIGGGLCVVLMALVQSPLQMVGVRAMLGAFAGAQVPAQALVAAETPPADVGRALGILASAMGLARTVGPLVGGILAIVFTLRHVFLASGIALIMAVLLVIFGVRETPRVRRGQGETRAGLRSIGPASRRSIMALVVVQGLVQFTFNAVQALLVIRLIGFDSGHPQLLVGVAFATAGLATVVSSTNYWRFTGRGYRSVATASCAAIALATVLIALLPTAVLVVVSTAVLGLAWGAVNPTISTLLGLEAPASVRGTVFGFNASFLAIGLAAGPIVGGLIAAVAGVPTGLLVCASAAAAAAFVVGSFVREPPAARSAVPAG